MGHFFVIIFTAQLVSNLIDTICWLVKRDHIFTVTADCRACSPLADIILNLRLVTSSTEVPNSPTLKHRVSASQRWIAICCTAASIWDTISLFRTSGH
jgi:hypothetical protein